MHGVQGGTAEADGFGVRPRARMGLQDPRTNEGRIDG